MILPAKSVRKASCMGWILNIILKEVCIRRILMLIFKYFHISYWACEVDNYIHWPMCLECYPDRHELVFGFQWSRLLSDLRCQLFYFLIGLISFPEVFIFRRETRMSSKRNNLISALVFYIQRSSINDFKLFHLQYI